MRRTIKIFFDQVGSGGIYVSSPDLAGLNLFLEDRSQVPQAVTKAIKILFEMNEGIQLRVLMEAPRFEDGREVSELRVAA